MPPETHYAKTADGVHIAYQTLGDGPGLVFVPGHVFDVEGLWSWPQAADFVRSLAGFACLAIFDQSGSSRSETDAGTNSSKPITTLSVHYSPAFVAARLTSRAMGFWPPLTAPRARCAVRP
jgi:hypothetical protein